MPSIPTSSINRTDQIVFRLRAAFFFIVLLLLVALVIAGVQLRYLNRSQVQAIEVSVPALAHSHKLENLLGKMLLLQGQIRTAKTSEAINDLTDQIEKLNADITQSTILSSHIIDATSLSRLKLQLDQLDGSNSSLLPIRIILNGSDVSLLTKRDNLVGLRIQFRDLIEPRLIETEIALNNSLLSINKNEQNSSDGTTAISEHVDTQNKLTEISFRFLAVVDAADQLARRGVNTPNTDITSQAKFNLHNATNLLASLRDDQFRRELAILVNKLRNNIFGDGGISAELSTKAEYQTQFDNAQEKQTKLVKSVSNQIDEVVNIARSDISLSANTFNSALFQTIATLAIAGLLIAVIVLLVSYFVVEKQINQRITQLTGAVLDIAKGDSSRNVPVGGYDEIGMMANALQVFKDTAVKLRTSNEELEQFAYAASHDLRSPLRAIENLAQWTIEDGGSDLPEDCRQNLKKILERAHRLSTLQTDLLEYSKAGHSDNVSEPVGIKPLVVELSEFLDPEKNYPIVFSGHTETVNTYVTPLRQVLLNLITNAIKHHDRPNGLISINVHVSGSRALISVQDDGPGIETKYQEQIFELFNMLQSQDEVEGSGLGLALVRKLVSRYDGKISVLSDPTIQRGTQFSFDWPMQIVSVT